MRRILFACIVLFSLCAHALCAGETAATPDQGWAEEHADRFTWHGLAPSAESADHDGGAYLRYSDSAYAYFERDDAGTWRLALWYAAEDAADEFYLSFSPTCLSIQTPDGHGGYRTRWLYGAPAVPLEADLIDMERLPDHPDGVFALWDTTGWAVVTEEEQPLYADASTASEAVCTLFAGAPVSVLQRQDGWIKVGAASLMGFIPETSACAGRDMLTVDRRFPDLCLSVEAVTPQTLVYAAPDRASPKLHALHGLQQASLDRVLVIGAMGSDWLLVFSPDGIAGCMESRWFSPGNG